MKRLVALFSLTLLFSGCSKNSNETWEGVKTAGRYLHKGLNSIMGKDYDSKLLTSLDDFTGPNSDDFIPLSDGDLQLRLAKGDIAIPQPKRFPGEKGSNLPGIDKFNEPSGELAKIFQMLHFDTDDHILRDKESIALIPKIASYMKQHTNLHLVIEGHCDERASADYNMALGMRRAQYVRVLLSKEGINPGRMYTISCGKEKPITSGHTADDWHKNRRAQFKIYEK
jgi:peptidoglycan-associated lipoprotein